MSGLVLDLCCSGITIIFDALPVFDVNIGSLITIFKLLGLFVLCEASSSSGITDMQELQLELLSSLVSCMLLSDDGMCSRNPWSLELISSVVAEDMLFSVRISCFTLTG